jgi:Carbohydrate esterase 2 N-terminal
MIKSMMLVVGLAGCSAPVPIESLPGSALVVYGRGLVNNGGMELIGSASHVGVSFTGQRCEVDVLVPGEAVHNYVQYELDGVYGKKLRVAGRQTVVIEAPGVGVHTLWLYKAGEAMSGPVLIERVRGESLKALKRSEGPVIEFIGNSITCGAMSDTSESPCGVGDYVDHHNAYYAYGPRAARALGVEYMLSSVSGIGIYRNWNSDGPTMPQVYEKAGLDVSDGRLWDFGKVRPAVVCIALGTNDFSHGDGKRARLPFDSVVFVSTYIRFVQLVKGKYPLAQIALLSSAMVGGTDGLLLKRSLRVVKTEIDKLYPSGKRVAVFDFAPMRAAGCGGHPSVEDHAVMAQELAPFLKGLL